MILYITKHTLQMCNSKRKDQSIKETGVVSEKEKSLFIQHCSYSNVFKGESKEKVV